MDEVARQLGIQDAYHSKVVITWLWPSLSKLVPKFMLMLPTTLIATPVSHSPIFTPTIFNTPAYCFLSAKTPPTVIQANQSHRSRHCFLNSPSPVYGLISSFSSPTTEESFWHSPSKSYQDAKFLQNSQWIDHKLMHKPETQWWYRQSPSKHKFVIL